MTDLKTVVLSAVDNSNKKAVLNLENSPDECYGSIRLYNFKDTVRGILTLGFLIDNQVFKAALTERGDSFYSFNFKTPNEVSKFSCALINIQNGDASPILLGSSDKSQDLNSGLVNNFKFLDTNKISVEEVRESLDKYKIDYEEEEKVEIEKAIDQECRDDQCVKCGYRTAFYGSEKCMAQEKPVIGQRPQPEFSKRVYPSSNRTNFYDEIKEQLNLLFEKYPEETFLNEVIPNSSWIKVDYEDDGHYIVIGLIYEDERVQYVCYGSPGEFSATPPAEFNGLSQWLPLDPDKPQELGYWIIYQDAENGQNVAIEVC